MKIFVIRDCLIQGDIREVAVSVDACGIARYPSGAGLVLGQWKASRKDALAAAEQMRAERLALLIEEIKRLENLEFKVL